MPLVPGTTGAIDAIDADRKMLMMSALFGTLEEDESNDSSLIKLL
jgi:hypothetical protein